MMLMRMIMMLMRMMIKPSVIFQRYFRGIKGVDLNVCINAFARKVSDRLQTNVISVDSLTERTKTSLGDIPLTKLLITSEQTSLRSLFWRL